jgi:hypothetical protein
MFKKSLKSKFLILGGALLLLGACKEENKNLSKLDETFSQFIKEQRALAEEEEKIELETKNIVTSEKELPTKSDETKSQDSSAAASSH